MHLTIHQMASYLLKQFKPDKKKLIKLLPRHELHLNLEQDFRVIRARYMYAIARNIQKHHRLLAVLIDGQRQAHPELTRY